MQQDRATVRCTSRPTTRQASTLTLATSMGQRSAHSPSVWPPSILQMKRCVSVCGKFNFQSMERLRSLVSRPSSLLFTATKAEKLGRQHLTDFVYFSPVQAQSLIEGLESGTATDPTSDDSTEAHRHTQQPLVPVPTTVTPPTSALAPPPPPPPPPPKLLESSQLKESETITWMMKHLPMRI